MATRQNLINPPPAFDLPLSLGQDLYLKLIYRTPLRDEEGELILDENGKKQFVVTDYPEDSAVLFEIDATSETTISVSATIEGSVATIWEDHETVDSVKARKLWRAKLTYANTLDKVMCNGEITREDGSKK